MLRRAALVRQPAHGTFELTSRCNLSCRICYVRHAPGDQTKAARELPASTWLDLVRQAVANGMVFLLLTGGEVFLRRDFFEIYEPLTRMGLVLALFTNGTLVTKDIAARLAQAPPSRTEITLYGASRLHLRGGHRCAGEFRGLLCRHRSPRVSPYPLRTQDHSHQAERWRSRRDAPPGARLGGAVFRRLAPFQTA